MARKGKRGQESLQEKIRTLSRTRAIRTNKIPARINSTKTTLKIKALAVAPRQSTLSIVAKTSILLDMKLMFQGSTINQMWRRLNIEISQKRNKLKKERRTKETTQRYHQPLALTNRKERRKINKNNQKTIATWSLHLKMMLRRMKFTFQVPMKNLGSLDLGAISASLTFSGSSMTTKSQEVTCNKSISSP